MAITLGKDHYTIKIDSKNPAKDFTALKKQLIAAIKNLMVTKENFSEVAKKDNCCLLFLVEQLQLNETQLQVIIDEVNAKE